MVRSKWKGPYIDIKLIKNYNNINTAKRNSEILPIFINRYFNVHNGYKNVSILITENMIGHKFGEFVFTRKKFYHKKKKNK
mmetsp:Transcript_196/g.472  ORF Transcript_196/g.472 Transcript_196/m.472 type:complete len:81 (+) Transcript_196:830-1072(+)